MRINAPVVVGYDGSAQSRQAVSWGAHDAALRSAPLLVVTTVFTPSNYGVPIGMPALYFDEQKTSAKRRLAEATELAAAAAGKHVLDVDVELANDPPVVVLREISKTAGLLAVGTRGHGELTGGLVGSVSSSLVVHALCPVVVLRGNFDDDQDTDTRPVVVGVDGSVHSEPAIAAAFDEAYCEGSTSSRYTLGRISPSTLVSRSSGKSIGRHATTPNAPSPRKASPDTVIDTPTCV
ncbi:universal stress protein [Rhodococcus qingshengii]|uniref:universal stress protein n=1 Tax=Rhodococcus qingshengii TaxID=334542 RepID=UPI001ABFD4A2|nr:universal stress protein [Rhodococcus qingshengii]